MTTTDTLARLEQACGWPCPLAFWLADGVRSGIPLAEAIRAVKLVDDGDITAIVAFLTRPDAAHLSRMYGDRILDLTVFFAEAETSLALLAFDTRKEAETETETTPLPAADISVAELDAIDGHLGFGPLPQTGKVRTKPYGC